MQGLRTASLDGESSRSAKGQMVTWRTSVMVTRACGPENAPGFAPLPAHMACRRRTPQGRTDEGRVSANTPGFKNGDSGRDLGHRCRPIITRRGEGGSRRQQRAGAQCRRASIGGIWSQPLQRSITRELRPRSAPAQTSPPSPSLFAALRLEPNRFAATAEPPIPQPLPRGGRTAEGRHLISASARHAE